MDTKNLALIRQSFAQAVFTHKVQEVAAESQNFKACIVKFANIILTLLSLISLVISNFYSDQNWIFFFGTSIGIAEIIFLIFQLFFNFEQKSVTHKNSALKYLELRDKYRLLIADLMNGDSKNDILVRRDLLQNQYQIICELSPQTSAEDYENAQKKLNKKGIVSGEEFTWSDNEIDRFLPEELRINKKK